MKHSKAESGPLQLYRGWNNCGFDGYVMAVSEAEAKRTLLSIMGVTLCKPFVFNVEPVKDVFLTEIE